MMHPFADWTGPLTRDAYKAMLLQLDPTDDEAEWIIRTKLERRTATTLRKRFADMLDTLYPAGYDEFADPDIEAGRIQQAILKEQALYDELGRAIRDSADLGVNVVIDQLENLGFSFDWTLVNQQAREWADRHTGELITNIAETTRRGVRTDIARWIDNGEPLEALTQDLSRYFGRDRAELIARNETTVAYTEGGIQAYQVTGLIDRPPRMRPVDDSHIGCRCDLSLTQLDDGTWSYIWLTANDEKVCPICGPLHGTLQ